MPALAALHDRSANVLLDHGSAVRTGLAWEHFWSGLSPEAAGRRSAVEFDPATYAVWQEGARFAPFFGPLDVRSVVLDPREIDVEWWHFEAALEQRQQGIDADPHRSGAARKPRKSDSTVCGCRPPREIKSRVSSADRDQDR